MITLLHPGSRPASRVSSNTASRLARLRIQTDRDHGLRLNLVINWICVRNLASRDCDRRGTIESEALQRRGINAIDTSFTSRRKGYRCFRDGKITAAKCIGDLEAQPLSAD